MRPRLTAASLFTLLLALCLAAFASACGAYPSHYHAEMVAYAPPPPRPIVMEDKAAPAEPEANRETYVDHGVNPWTQTDKDALSTFAIDVDTGAYTISRRKLNEGTLPAPAAVRVEEFVNYFKYAYAPPTADDLTPFSVHVEAAPSPVAEDRHIVRVGLQGRPIDHDQRRPAHLVFLVDVSGSMDSSDKLGLAKDALIYLTEQLQDHDTVSLVTYAGSIGVVLPATPVSDRDTIIDALDELTSGGSTAMASGLQLAYEQALSQKEPGTIQRVIVISDGDANVGSTTHGDMLTSIQHYVNEGVTLSTIGVGMGNYQDNLMEQLANQGNGNYYYLDTFDQAKRVFGQDLTATLQVIARDVKVQVAWNPERVSSYRLIGYENRDVADKDFRNDAVDGGEVGAGHQVTALYEVKLNPKAAADAPLADVHLRYKSADARPEDKAREVTLPISADALRATLADASDSTRFAFAVASFAEVLRQSPEGMPLSDAIALAKSASDGVSDSEELLNLMEQAQRLGADVKKTARLTR
jgi:Ca-activated chloride channel homolog